MNRSATIALLTQHKDYLVRQFGVSTLVLFGSVARDGATEHSDVDVLETIEFSVPTQPRASLTKGMAALAGIERNVWSR